MAKWGVQFQNVALLMDGVSQVLKTSGVKTLLAQQGAKAAAKANKAYSFPAKTNKDPYAYKVSTGEYSSYAVVHVNSLLGKLDNQHNGTLRKELLDD